MANPPTRRHFLRSAPLAAVAAALPLGDALLLAQTASTAHFEFIPASRFAAETQTLTASPGNFTFSNSPALPFSAVLTVEEHKSAKEFEWHEGRDHLLQIVDGTTVYQVGGTPQQGRNIRPGEWLAPQSDGATTLTLHKGDWLIIPRNTPHKRSTAHTVTFFLISTTGEAKA